MAMSFPRDHGHRADPPGADDVADVEFSTVRKGYDPAEVRAQLRDAARRIADLEERVAGLRAELDQERQMPLGARLDDETLTRMLGEETARVLGTARESAAEIRHKAGESAARLVSEAGDEANRLREEAEVEAARRRADAANDAEAELEMARQQGREMVNEARAYRERVLSELARRRELAREQIEQLVHGRDRLLGAFERARLAAVDVIAEMQPIGEPDEYVNLQPTTGPVPVMVAREQGDGTGSEADAAGDDGSEADAAGDDGSEDVSGAEANEDGDADTLDADTIDRNALDEVDADPVTDDSAESPADESTDDVSDSDIDDVADGDPGSDRDDASLVGDDDTHADTEHDDGAIEVDDASTGDDLTDTDDGDDVDRIDAPDDASSRPATDDETARTESEGADVGAATAETDGDGDVVVDLFARLRASRSDDDVSEDHTTGDEDGAGSDAATESVSPDPGAADADTSDADTSTSDTRDADTSDAPAEVGDPAAEPFLRRDEAITPLITEAARRIKRVLADEQNEVLETLRRQDSVTTLDELLPWVGEHVGRCTDALHDALVAAADAGAADTDPAGSATITAAQSRAAVEKASDTVETWLVVPLRDRLDRAVADHRGDNPAITKAVRAVYREFKTGHLDEHLDDVLLTAHAHGALAAFGDGRPVRWATDPRDPACADCEDNTLEGVIGAGRPFPTGAITAPAHPGCRCLVVAADG